MRAVIVSAICFIAALVASIAIERQFFGFKPSDGYVFRSPGWPTK